MPARGILKFKWPPHFQKHMVFCVGSQVQINQCGHQLIERWMTEVHFILVFLLTVAVIFFNNTLGIMDTF
jgi:hypothetical protein